MSVQELEQRRRELEAKVGELASARAEIGAKIATNETAVRDLTTAVQRLQEAQTNVNRDAAEPTGRDADLRFYTGIPRSISIDEHGQVRTDDTDERRTKRALARNAPCYRQGPAGQIRMTGHRTESGGFVYGLLDDPNPRTPWQRELQRAATMRTLVRAALNPKSSKATPIADEMVLGVLEDAPRFIRERMFADSTGIGGEWIPDTWAEVERETAHQVGFANIFAQRNVGPGGTLHLPFVEGELLAYKGAIPTTDDPADATLSDFTSRENTITTSELVVGTQIHRDATEDMLIPVWEEVMGKIVRSIAIAKDNIAINGDTAASHQDTIATWNIRSLLKSTGLGTTADHRRISIGLRARATDISNTVDQNAAQTAAGAKTAMKRLGPEYYGKVGSVIFATSPEYFLGTMLGFTELMTWDKVGPAATILTGMLPGKGVRPGSVGFLWGREVVITPMISADLATTGLYTGSGSTTGMLVLDTDDFEWRLRKDLRAESQENIRNNTHTLVARTRLSFRTKANDTGSTRKNVNWSYNLTA